METFLKTLIAIYASLPPGVGYHTASVLGSVAGLILFPVENWRAGASQLFVGYMVSHFFWHPLQLVGLFVSWPVETVRFALGAFGFAIAQGVAKVIRRFRDDPTGTVKDAVRGAFAETLTKIRELLTKKT